jgi:ABC-2 type transport system ATP-binding protein
MAALKVEHLVKRYGSLTILHDVSLEVRDHSLFGLLGLNGAGKTTTLHCALGLARPTSGSTEVLGVRARDIHRTHGRVGVLFDTSTNFGQLTVRQNLELARQLIGKNGGRTPDDVERLLDIHRVSNRRAKKLSFGMQRRLAIARALLGTPELVIMDEPLSGLDADGVDQMLDLARELHREEGTTFILLSHRLHELETIVSDVALIHEGRVIASGALQDVLGGRGHAVLVRVDRPSEARAVLSAMPLVSAVELDGDGRLRVRGTCEPADLNQALLRAGFRVSELREDRVSLADFFRQTTRSRAS